MAHAPTCPHCGVELQPGTYFCSECGKAVPATAQAKKSAPKTTMLGMAAVVQPKGAAADDPGRTTAAGLAEPPRGRMGRTMLGMPVSPPPSEARPAPAPAPEQPGSAARAANPAAPAKKTMIGLPPGDPPAPRAADGALPAEPVRPAVGGDSRHARTPAGATSTAAAPPPVDPNAVTQIRGDAKRTAMGLAPGSPEVPGAQPEAGAAAASRASSEPQAVRARGSRPSGTGRASASSVPLLGRVPSKLAQGLALLALSAAAVLTYLALRPASGPAVRVRVVSSAEGEQMIFEVPGARAGTKLRFGGQEKPLEAGRASFPLAPDSLRVGKNVVPYDLLEPGGEIESGKLGLEVAYRVTLDTAPLRAGEPAVDVVVSALPGSQVWLDGQPVALDAHGRAVRKDALEPAKASDRVEHLVRYRVQPPSAEVSVGELRTSIPVTMMQIDKPGLRVTTDRDSIEIAGAVDKDARVTIDGQAVEVISGRFLHRHALPEARAYALRVVASSPGKAPRAITLDITRVDDLREAARNFVYDSTLTYAKIAQNPAIYRGQQVAFEGRVYNVTVEAGKSALQMLVRECPAGQRCPIWVSYHAATEYTVDSWVRVLGVIEGEQQFRSEADEVKVVPKVEAAFLLAAKP